VVGYIILNKVKIFNLKNTFFSIKRMERPCWLMNDPNWITNKKYITVLPKPTFFNEASSINEKVQK